VQHLLANFRKRRGGRNNEERKGGTTPYPRPQRPDTVDIVRRREGKDLIGSLFHRARRRKGKRSPKKKDMSVTPKIFRRAGMERKIRA